MVDDGITLEKKKKKKTIKLLGAMDPSREILVLTKKLFNFT